MVSSCSCNRPRPSAVAMCLCMCALGRVRATSRQLSVSTETLKIMASREAAVEFLAVKATQSMTAQRRCYVIGPGLQDPTETDVICSPPECGERLSEAMPRYLCHKVWGTADGGA